MLKAILRLFPYVRELEDELGRQRRALESASRYADLLEALKDSQAKRIGALEAERDELFRRLSGGAR